MANTANTIVELIGHLPPLVVANTGPQLVARVQEIVDVINSTPLNVGTEYIEILDD